MCHINWQSIKKYDRRGRESCSGYGAEVPYPLGDICKIGARIRLESVIGGSF